MLQKCIDEWKFVFAETFIRTSQNKIYKYVTSISKDGYIDKLDDIANKYDNKYHSTIKMKTLDVKSNKYISSSEGINDKDPKLKNGDLVRIPKPESIFAKDYFVTNWSEELFVIKNVKNTVLWKYVNKYVKKLTKKNLELKE